MKKAILGIFFAVVVGIISPQIVKALTSSGIVIYNNATGELVEDIHVYGVFGALSAGNMVDKLVIVQNVNGVLAVADNLSPDNAVNVTYTIAGGGFEVAESSFSTLKSNNYLPVKLTPKVYCGDGVCTTTKENLTNCPYDCAICGDNVCTNYEVVGKGPVPARPNNKGREHGINCPVDCSVPKFVRGDADVNGKIDSADGQRVLNWLFTGGVTLPCQDAADANDDGQITQADQVTISDYVGKRRSSLPAPFPAKGYDPTADGLKCGQYPY